MRCFIAFDLSKEVKDYLYGLQKKLNTRDVKVKWVAKKNLHGTIKFLGDISDEEIDRVGRILEKISFEPFELSLDGLGFFPSKDYIRVIWIGLKPVIKLRELQHLIDAETLSVAAMEQSFSEHLTLGRVKFIKNKERFRKTFIEIEIEPLKFKVDGFVLYRSELTKEGPKYFVIREFKF